MRTIFRWVLLPVVLAGILFFIHLWAHTAPIWVYPYRQTDRAFLDTLPARNKKVIDFIEAEGARIAPSYAQAVCTEFVIEAIEPFAPLTRAEKRSLRVITDQDLMTLVQAESPVIRGVQQALTQGNKGTAVTRVEDVRPGDFVQFWNVYGGWVSGHCGIVAAINPGKTITVYSSHPVTGGYGRQLYLWPDKAFFVRLR
jgi:hypothetical protein